MAEIKINAKEFEDLLLNTLLSINNLSHEIFGEVTSEPDGCKGIMLNNYYEEIGNIRKLLEKYVELLRKDIQDIIICEKEMLETDKAVAGDFKE